MAAVAVVEEFPELVLPRVCHVPAAADWAVADRAVAWCRAHGLRLDSEQEFMLRSMLGVDRDGRWQAFEGAMNAPRQNGKNEVLIARELFGIYELGEMSIVHSAHEFKTSAKHFARMEATIRRSPDLLARVKRSDLGERRLIGFRYSHGDECIELDNGAKIEFRTRTKSGMKGFDDVAVLVLDEAQVLSEWAHGAMVPTMRASTAVRGPQLIYSGNAPDKDRDDHALVWTRVRERGIAGDDESLVYFEYSLDYETPDDIPDDVLADLEVWGRVNWAMGRGRITAAHMAKELNALGRRQFCVELLGVGDYPDTDLAGNQAISQEAWADCEDPESVLQDPVCVMFEVSPSRRSTISAAGFNGSGKKHVEVVNDREGTAWVPERLAELCAKWDVVEIVCDGFGPANMLADRVEEQTGLTVRRLKTGEYVDACGMFANDVEERALVHIGQEQLSTSVRGARTRPLVDRWAWSRSKSRTNAGPVIACSGALWSAVDRNVASREEFVIF